MAERPIAETQYGDFRGEIALDRSSDPRVPKLTPEGGWDAEKFPVVGYRVRKSDGNVQLSMICLDKTLESKSSQADVPRPAREFRLKASADEIWSAILRLDVVVASVPLDELLVELSIPDRSH